MRTPLHRRTEKIGACLADPFANGEGRIELIRSPSPKGAGGRCIDLVIMLAQSAARCQSKTYAGYLPIALTLGAPGISSKLAGQSDHGLTQPSMSWIMIVGSMPEQ